MKSLALDIANTTGWCTDRSSGTFSSVGTKGKKLGYKFIVFKQYLTRLIIDHEIEIVYYEQPIQGMFTALRSGCNYEGVLILVCEELNIEYQSIQPTAIKKFAKLEWERLTNNKHKGNVKKEHMIKFMREALDQHVIDDNHADAIWLYLKMNQ